MSTIELTLPDSGRSVEAAAGDELIVSLSETPTSGYRWQPDDALPAALTPSADDYLPPGTGLGGAGVRVFEYALEEAGSFAIRLVCRRAWEDASGAVETFEASIVVG